MGLATFLFKSNNWLRDLTRSNSFLISEEVTPVPAAGSPFSFLLETEVGSPEAIRSTWPLMRRRARDSTWFASCPPSSSCQKRPSPRHSPRSRGLGQCFILYLETSLTL
ncbi:hypothetical protein NPIL_477431 [Nephila pilipes]|uniref:Uncharacterized protein n=1 Tax=Nephila pilipes TaxID=299642 RepID=A0A8X6PRL8_NEPPI|nr:hypothetical protein NPIL_477431 [Nephila pilipes]